MTPRSRRNLGRILREVPKRIEQKYRKGSMEHGDDLFEIDLVDEAIDEAIDLIIYLYTLRAGLKKRGQ